MKLNSLVVKSEGSGDQAPRTVKLFTNRPNLGFSEASSFPPVQQFSLTEADLQGKALPLKYAHNSCVPFSAEKDGQKFMVFPWYYFCRNRRIAGLPASWQMQNDTV